MNPVDKTNLSCYTSHPCSTTVSLETYPSIVPLTSASLTIHTQFSKNIKNTWNIPAPSVQPMTSATPIPVCILPNAECRTPNAERQIPNSERRMQNTERRTLNAEGRTPNTERKISVSSLSCKTCAFECFQVQSLCCKHGSQRDHLYCGQVLYYPITSLNCAAVLWGV